MSKVYTSVSELKVFNTCKRQWYFSGRNGLYYRPAETSDALKMGSVFHEALEHIYKREDFSITNILDKHQVTSRSDRNLIHFQISKYKDIIYEQDYSIFNNIETEKKFEIEVTDKCWIHGYIDLVYVNENNNKIEALEHKFVRYFRGATENILDLQLKTYNWVLVELYGYENVGGVSINEIRKLTDSFAHSREKYKLTKDQLVLVENNLIEDLLLMKEIKENNIAQHRANASWANCRFCEYSDLCKKMDKAGTNDTSILTDEDFKKSKLIQKEVK